jgi:hypothetical protein
MSEQKSEGRNLAAIKKGKEHWSNKESLDIEDIAHNIAKQYTPEQFAQLPLSTMLTYVEIAGTSSSILFDTFLRTAKREYTSTFSEAERLLLERVHERLVATGLAIKEHGTEGRMITATRPADKFYVKSLPSLSTLEEIFGKEEGAKLWTLRLGSVLLVVMWESLVNLSEDTKKEKSFIKEMYQCMNGRDRQWGYYGGRGSVVNETLLFAAKHPDAEIRTAAIRSLALLGDLREICKEVSGREDFWPYAADSKTLRSTLIYP